MRWSDRLAECCAIVQLPLAPDDQHMVRGVIEENLRHPGANIQASLHPVRQKIFLSAVMYLMSGSPHVGNKRKIPNF